MAMKETNETNKYQQVKQRIDFLCKSLTLKSVANFKNCKGSSSQIGKGGMWDLLKVKASI